MSYNERLAMRLFFFTFFCAFSIAIGQEAAGHRDHAVLMVWSFLAFVTACGTVIP